MSWELLLALIVAHYLADYPLQGAFLAERKVDALQTSIGTHALTAHAMIQGGLAGATFALFGLSWSLPLGIVAVTHWLIDLGKARDGYGLTTDQLLHGLVLGWLALTLGGVGPGLSWDWPL